MKAETFAYIVTLILVRVTDISSTSFCRWTAWCCSCTALESSWKRQTASEWMSCFSCCGTASCCRRASLLWPVCCCWRSWSSELEAGCSAAPRTSTTTVKLLTRTSEDKGAQQLFHRCVGQHSSTLDAGPLSPLITKPAASPRKTAEGFLKSAAHKL